MYSILVGQTIGKYKGAVGNLEGHPINRKRSLDPIQIGEGNYPGGWPAVWRWAWAG